MITILVVDDESIVLEGIEVLIKNNFPQVSCQKAINGPAALELMRQIKPDIIISDIYMPIMNGLNFCEQAKQLYPSVEIILISAYEAFDYARQSLHVGIRSYIMKPISQAELQQEIAEAIHAVEQKEQKRREEKELVKLSQEHKLASLAKLSAQDGLDHDEIDGKFLLCRFYALIRIDFMKAVNESDLCLRLDQAFMCREAAGNYVIHRLGSRQFIVLATVEGQGLESDISNLCHHMIDENYDGLYVWSEIGQSSTSKIMCLYTQMKYMHFKITLNRKLRRSVAESYNDLIDSSAFCIFQQAMQTRVPERFQHLVQMLPGYLSFGNPQVFMSELDNIYHEWNRQNVSSIDIRKRLIWLVLSIIEYISNSNMVIESPDIDINIADKLFFAASLDDIIHEISVCIHRLSRSDESGQEGHTHLMHRIVQEIKRDCKSATLNQIASQAGITPIYLSTLFKEQMGENFKDYVMRQRMNLAKELLNNESLKIYQVAEYVGYSESKYFSKVFKKIWGITPVYYRESCLNRAKPSQTTDNSFIQLS